jgi:hypothetical protein
VENIVVASSNPNVVLISIYQKTKQEKNQTRNKEN